MACCLSGTKLLPEAILPYYQLDFWEQILLKFESKIKLMKKHHCKMLAIFFQASMLISLYQVSQVK